MSRMETARAGGTGAGLPTRVQRGADRAPDPIAIVEIASGSVPRPRIRVFCGRSDGDPT